MRSVVRVVVFAVLLLCVAAAILAFAHSYANLPAGQRCAASAGWLGCAMAAHESLAGGLLGSFGILVAAFVAYEAIQQQIARDRDALQQQLAESRDALRQQLAQDRDALQQKLAQDRDALQQQLAQDREAVRQQLDALRRREEELAAERAMDQSRRDEDAKLTAIMLIRNAIHISAVILRWLRQASDAKGSALTRAMQQVHFGVRQLQGVLDQRSLMEVASRLGAADRSHYVAIATNLTAFVNLAMYPPPGTQWDLLNATQREHLQKLRPSLEALDAELAAVFERDSDFVEAAA